MSAARSTTESTPPWSAAWGVCTGIGLLTGLRLSLTYGSVGRPITWLEALTSGLMEWWLWALLYPLLAFGCRRWPLRGPRIPLALAVHLVGSVALAGAHLVLFAVTSAGVRSLVYGTPFRVGSFSTGVIWQVPFSIAVVWAAVFGVTALTGRRALARELVRAAELREELARTRLEALRLHLQPHFLFNTLNAITAAIHSDPDVAERMLTRLGELLRHLLDRSEEREIPLCEELDLLGRYVEIEQVRYGARLTVRLEPESSTLEARVPPLLLQPLVENALRHGIARRTGPGTVTVRTGRSDGVLWLEVEDDGIGPQPETDAAGVGLSNTRKRLLTLYGEAQLLDLVPAPGGRGTLVRVELPWNTERAA